MKKNPQILSEGFSYSLVFVFNQLTISLNRPKPSLVVLIHNVFTTVSVFRFIFRLVFIILVYIKLFLSLFTISYFDITNIGISFGSAKFIYKILFNLSSLNLLFDNIISFIYCVYSLLNSLSNT